MSNVLRREPVTIRESRDHVSAGVMGCVAVIAVLLAALVWAYWSTLVGLNNDWQRDQNYSVGQIVPLAALYLLWNDRQRLASLRPQACWWGIAVIVIAQVGRVYGMVTLRESAERYAFVLTLIGVVMLVGGWRVFWQIRWILAFLFLMVPLPNVIHNAISGPLQEQATSGAVFSLELLGITVSQDGNVIMLNDSVPVAVAEACSGLRMLTAFVVVAAVLAYIVRRPPWQRVVLLVSSVPIAIFCNLVRLVVTSLLFLEFSNELAERFFHDFAGFTMMPMAVLLLVGEMWIMNQLVIDDTQTG